MHEHDPISRARGNFQQFVSFLSTDYLHQAGNPEEEAYLQEYMFAWLDDGDAVPCTNKNYELYLRVAFDIGDATLRGAIDFSYVPDGRERRIKGFHDSRFPESAQFLDKLTYEDKVFDYEQREAERLAQLAWQPLVPPASEV